MPAWCVWLGQVARVGVGALCQEVERDTPGLLPRSVVSRGWREGRPPRGRQELPRCQGLFSGEGSLGEGTSIKPGRQILPLGRGRAGLPLAQIPAGQPRGSEPSGGGGVQSLKCSLPSASSTRCANSRKTSWNLLPPPQCRAERRQAPLPRPSPGPPAKPSGGGAPGPAPTPQARSRGVQGPRQAPSSGRSSSAHASRRVGPAPAARPPLLPGAPGLRPAQAVPLRPRKRRCPCAPGAREPPESGSPPAPHTPAPTPKHSGPAGPVAAIGPSGPVGTPSHSASAKSSVFSSTSTFRWGWLSALPGRPPGGTGSSSKAGAGVCPAPSWPQPPREGPGTRRSRKKCS